MRKRLFLLDAMVLAYRSYFALIRRPIFTSGGFNSSALYGYTQTLMEILKNQEPTHIAVVFDSETPTRRHEEFPQYKAQREAMPEDLSQALPHVRRISAAFNIPVLTLEGYEADDIIGALVRRAEEESFESYMVTPDKDFGQLVSDKTFLYKPSRMGDGVEVLGRSEICRRWGIERPEQITDIMGLWGDSADNIPGVPGIGEKTACKLIAQYGTLENLLAHTHELSGRIKENLGNYREQALMSKHLATIDRDAPVAIELDDLQLRQPDEEALRAILVEFEFRSIGRRLLGEDFNIGGEASGTEPARKAVEPASRGAARRPQAKQAATAGSDDQSTAAKGPLKTITDVEHTYRLVTDPHERSQLIRQLAAQSSFCFDVETTDLAPKDARLLGIAFSFAAQTGYYVHLPEPAEEATTVLEEFRPVLEDARIKKVGHNLKFDLSVLRWQGIEVRGALLDTMIAHSLIDPEMRHNMDYLAEAFLGYRPVPITRLLNDDKQLDLHTVRLDELADYAAEDADVTWQLWSVLEPMLKERGQERVYYEVEAPLIPVLVDMEYQGIRIDGEALDRFARHLLREMADIEQAIYRLAGREFNLNSPRQLGDVLFGELKIAQKPKKTPTGQYATDEQTLQGLASEHEIVRRLLDYREMMKLKSTYADTLPNAISPKTGRIHTTYSQTVTATGRLASQEPNLQNIPIRSELGREIRKAFVPRNDDYSLLAADYSQVELRIIASVSREPGMMEAFRQGLDIHTTTAAKVYDVPLDQVSDEMRRQAKMVNFGIIYGISAFGLAQRLGIRRREAASLIDQYFAQYPMIRKYIDDTIALARERGYVETMTGRRRYLRDINSSNATVRSGSERNAINAPIQGTAADMIKLAMIRIHEELTRRNLRTKMLLQVHDELLFDLYQPEKEEVLPMVEEQMKRAIPLEVPIVVELGVGRNWVEAH